MKNINQFLRRITAPLTVIIAVAACDSDNIINDTDNEAPTVAFTATPKNPVVNEEVSFTDGSTDADGKVVQWIWNFGDNTTSTDQHPRHAFAKNAAYDVILTITDDKGATAKLTQQFFVADPTVANQEPTAAFTVADTLTFAGSDILFSDASADADGGVVSWAWDFGDNGTATTQNPTHAYPQLGVYTVTLSATDNRGATKQYTKKIYVGGIRWTYALAGKVESVAPAIGDDGTVYITASAKGGSNNVYAVTADGTARWSYAAGDIIRSSPAIAANGTVYTASYDDKLYAFDGASGTVQWTYTLGDNAKYSSAAIAGDGTIYIGSQKDKIHAVNPNGTVKWEFATGGDVNGTPAIGTDGTVYAAAVDGYLYALDPATGTQKWKIQFGAYIGGSLALGSDGTIYVSGNRGSGDTESGVLLAVHPDGTQKWAYESLTKIDQGGPALGTDGTVYIGTKKPELVALDGATGTAKWTYTDARLTGVGSNPAVDNHGNIIFGDDGGTLTVLRASGSLRLQMTLGVKVWSSPVIADDGTLYIGADQADGTGLLYALNIYSSGPATSSWPMKGGDRKHTGR